MQYKISGILNNCALNTALPIMLQDLSDLARLEGEENLPIDCQYFSKYSLLKETFAEVYELENESLSWNELNIFLKSFNSFLATQIIFLPVFRKFIGKIADTDPEYKDNLSSLTDIQSLPSEEGAYIGKYNPLYYKEAQLLFHGNFGINISRVNEETQVIETDYNLPSPEWSTIKNDRCISLYFRAGHFEIYENPDIRQYTMDLDSLETSNKELSGIILNLSTTKGVEETKSSLDKLKSLVNGWFVQQKRDSDSNYAKTLGTESTKQFKDEVEFPKRSNIISPFCYQIFTSVYFRVFMLSLIIAAALTLTAIILSNAGLSSFITAFIVNLTQNVQNILFGVGVVTAVTATVGLGGSFWANANSRDNYSSYKCEALKQPDVHGIS